MSRPLQVYGWWGFRVYRGKWQQCRIICAAHSVAEIMRITGVKRSHYNHSGCVTGNPTEIVVAMSQPGVAFYAPLDYRVYRLEDWEVWT